MASTTAGRAGGQREYSGGAVGLISFAGVLMILGGILHVVQGIVAIVDDKFFVVTADYVFQFDTTTWGWIHLIGGIVVALAGGALFSGATWARTVAVIVAGLSIIANFMWMPWYPFWSVTVIAFDVFVIWAVTVHGRDITEA
jgi:hypothetical protein